MIIYVEIDSKHVCGAIHHMEGICKQRMHYELRPTCEIIETVTTAEISICDYLKYVVISVRLLLFAFREESNLEINMQTRKNSTYRQ